MFCRAIIDSTRMQTLWPPKKTSKAVWYALAGALLLSLLLIGVSLFYMPAIGEPSRKNAAPVIRPVSSGHYGPICPLVLTIICGTPW